MSVDIFTKERFEDALPKHKRTNQPIWQCRGMVDNELEYYLPIDDKVGVIVRSSIDWTGYSAATGEDSIRAWLADINGNMLGSKVSKWTTRKPNWESRLIGVLRTLWSWRLKAGDCPHCNQPKKIFKVNKDGPNKGRIFAKCDTCANNGWVWLED